MVGGGGGGVIGCGARHVGAPDSVDTQVFIEDHEEVVEPALAEAFVVEVGIGCVSGVGLDLRVS